MRSDRTNGLPRTAVVVAGAAIAIALIMVGLWYFGAPPAAPSASPSAAPSSPTRNVAPSPSSAPPSAAASPASPGPGVRPDALHGVIVATGNLRTEDDPRGLQQPSLFMTAPTTPYAVSADGTQIALIRTSQAGQQLVTFTTTRPNDIRVAVDLASTGEIATNVVWAGDSNYLVYGAVRRTGPAISYSALRSVDLAAGKQSEIARITNGLQLVPLAWRFDTHLGAALEQQVPSAGIVAYDVIRDNSLTDRTTFSGVTRSQLNASRDGKRVLLSLSTGIRWWPVDQPNVAHELAAAGGQSIGYAEFRPGADEIGVDVATGFEIWTLAGDRRVVAKRSGFERWRVDGSAAIASSDPYSVVLIDPVNGAVVPLPGGGFPLADVVMF